MSGYPPPYATVQDYPSDPYKTAAHEVPPPQGPHSSAPPTYASQAAYYPPPVGYSVPLHGGITNAGYGQEVPINSSQPGYNQYAGSEEAHPKPDNSLLFGSSFSDKAIRRGFIRKVYLILFAQLMVTFAFICLFIFVKPLKIWVQENLWFYLLAYGLFLVLYITLVCCPGVRRQSPGNWICLSLFTLAFSYMTATISSFHDTGIVLMAAGITAAVCLSISIFAIQTKIDFTLCSGLLFALVMVLFFFGFACLITNYAWGSNRIMSCVYGGLAALVFGLFLIYDTQLIMGGRKFELSPEEYIYGALQLYIDIIYIFIIILGFMGNK